MATARLMISRRTMGQAVSRQIEGDIAERARDFRPCYKALLLIVARHQAEAFAAEGAVGGLGKWAPLSPAYAATKAEGSTILTLTGKLALQTQGEDGAIILEEPHSLCIQTNIELRGKKTYSVDLGRMHARGRQANGRPHVTDMPKRSPFCITEALASELGDAVATYLIHGEGTL